MAAEPGLNMESKPKGALAQVPPAHRAAPEPWRSRYQEVLDLQHRAGNSVTARSLASALDDLPGLTVSPVSVRPRRGGNRRELGRGGASREDSSESRGHAATEGKLELQPPIRESNKSLRALQAMDEDTSELDPELRRVQTTPPSATPTAPPTPAPMPGAAPSAPPPPSHGATFTLSGNSYADKGGESRKKIKFNATWKGGVKEDYIIVNWVKGHMKNSSGKPFKAKLYGKLAPIDFADWQVDSPDEDPAYWSLGGTRWRYTVDGPTKFSATDNPGPMGDSDGKGAEAKLDFKTAVYKSADVPTKTSGSISATPLSSFQPWDYHVTVLGGGKFDH